MCGVYSEPWHVQLLAYDYLQRAEEAEAPNMNFLFARNASLPGLLYMTFSGKEFKLCINTATAFYNKYNTCSNCEDFVKNPERWHFVKTEQPEVGDILIQYHAKTGRAYHAGGIVEIKDGRYYINHAVKKNYIKHVEVRGNSKLASYRFDPR